jgi:hypothetical protein
MARLHALVIGVSAYPHSQNRQLGSVRGPAISAARFAEWLRTKWRHPEFELGSLKVLLSPTEDEAETALAAAGGVSGRATSQNVRLAVWKWAELCNDSDDDIALLFVAGHGTESLYGGGVLLLEDHGSPGGALAYALDLDFVQKAIGTSEPTRTSSSWTPVALPSMSRATPPPRMR